MISLQRKSIKNTVSIFLFYIIKCAEGYIISEFHFRYVTWYEANLSLCLQASYFLVRILYYSIPVFKSYNCFKGCYSTQKAWLKETQKIG